MLDTEHLGNVEKKKNNKIHVPFKSQDRHHHPVSGYMSFDLFDCFV